MNMEEFIQGFIKELNILLGERPGQTKYEAIAAKRADSGEHRLLIKEFGSPEQTAILSASLKEACLARQRNIPIREIAAAYAKQIAPTLKYFDAKKRLFPRAIRAKENKESLNLRPHKIIGDIAIAYVLKDSEGNERPIYTETLKKMQINEETLHRDAMKNGDEELTFFTLKDLSQKEEWAEPLLNITKNTPVYMVFSGSNDASYVIADVFGLDLLSAQNENKDLLVVPSSKEFSWIVVTEDDRSEEIASLLRTTALYSIPKEETLSTMIFRYHAKEKELSILSGRQ